MVARPHGGDRHTPGQRAGGRGGRTAPEWLPVWDVGLTQGWKHQRKVPGPPPPARPFPQAEDLRSAGRCSGNSLRRGCNYISALTSSRRDVGPCTSPRPLPEGRWQAPGGRTQARGRCVAAPLSLMETLLLGAVSSTGEELRGDTWGCPLPRQSHAWEMGADTLQWHRGPKDVGSLTPGDPHPRVLCLDAHRGDLGLHSASLPACCLAPIPPKAPRPQPQGAELPRCPIWLRWPRLDVLLNDTASQDPLRSRAGRLPPGSIHPAHQ